MATPLRAAKRLLSPATRRDQADHRRLLDLIAGLPPDADCVDIGAYRGEVLAAMVRCAPEGRHVAFEPVPALRSALERRFPTVDARGCALADYDGRAAFQVVASGWSRFLSAGQLDGAEVISVPVRTLDGEDLSPQFIKIDAEGAELAVLRGGRRTLTEHRPLMVFEHGTATADTADLFHLLAGLGYRIFDLRGGGPYSAKGFEEAARDPALINFVARPHS